MIRWTTKGHRRPRNLRYSRATPPFPGGLWATDQLSAIHERVTDWAQNEAAMAHASVFARSRVDTGMMRGRIVSQTQYGDTVGVEFGWFDDNPFYAKFQEFGIDPFGNHPGFEGMDAVKDTFDESVKRMLKAIGG